jgi:hypothetical protein
MEAAMRVSAWILAGVIGAMSLSPVHAADGSGLSVPGEPSVWPRWQGRVAIALPVTPLRSDWLGGDASGLKVAGLSVIGDYYFAAPWRFGNGALRATGGLLYGPRALFAGRPALGAARPMLSIERQWSSALQSDAGGDASTVPYVGLGYTGLSGTGRFSYSADLGLVARNPGQAVQFGRVLGGAQNLDDLVRDMRLAPVLQLRVLSRSPAGGLARLACRIRGIAV